MGQCWNNSYSRDSQVPFFVSDVIFLSVVLLTFLGASAVWLTHRNARVLLGPFYFLALFFLFVENALKISALVIAVCTAPWDDDWDKRTGQSGDLQIPIIIFRYLGEYLVLVIILWQVNSRLHKQLPGDHPRLLKAIYAAILGIMGCTAIPLVVLRSKVWWEWFHSNNWFTNEIEYHSEKLTLAYAVLYFVSGLAASAISLQIVYSMRSQGLPIKGLSIRVGSLVFFTFIWTLFTLVNVITQQSNPVPSENVAYAFAFIHTIFVSSSFIAILFIAKDVGEKAAPADEPSIDPKA